MKIISSILAICFVLPACADTTDLENALKNTYRACVGIDDQLHDLKVMAGINTAVSSVGTVAGVGATITGLAKKNIDNKILEKLRGLEQSDPNFGRGQNYSGFRTSVTTYLATIPSGPTANTKIEQLDKKSKKLGNWRTGLMAGATATNVTGVVLSINEKKRLDNDIVSQINNCKDSVEYLRYQIAAARLEKIDVSEANSIVTACAGYNNMNLGRVEKLVKNSLVASGVGTATGVAGTITSAVANSDKIRNNDTDAGQQTEKNLNVASNVLAIGTTAASATATIFNASQISEIKKLAAVSEKCSGVLK